MAVRRTTVTEESMDAAQPNADQARQEEIARKDAAIMQGGPGSEVEPEKAESPVTPQVQEVTIGGRKFAVDPDLARQLEQREQDFNRKLNEHSQELGELRKLVKPPPVEPQPKGYDTLLFENPVEAVNRLKREITEEVTAQYQQDQSQQRFWNGFYSQHKDLDRGQDDFLVRGVLQQNWNTLSVLPPDEAAEKLADLTRRQILRYSQKAKLEDETDNPQPAARTVVESASRPTPSRAPRQDEGPATLTDVIKQRRLARARGRAA